MQAQILTVTQLNYSVRHLLEGNIGQIWLTGEISNFTQPASGHWYFTLKDDQAQVRCAMFRMKNQRVNFRPQHGMQVLVRASVTLYEPRGDYQLQIETMQMAGEGLLQQQFEQLKAKLSAEGLFDMAHKKALPPFAKQIGIITSASGAALQDMLNVLARRDPSLQIVIYPTLVQGKEAVGEIVQAIELANLRRECEVLILGRGGGSLEDLWCFNEEAVARAIFASALPIISAVGHETDVTIADFVADLRAPTPSAAAELVSRDQQELRRQLKHQFDKINLAFDRLWAEKEGCFQQLCLRLNAQHPSRQLKQQQWQLAQHQQRLERSIWQLIQQRQQLLQQWATRLSTQHPQRRLAQQRQQLAQSHRRLEQAMEQYWLQKQQRWQHLTQRTLRNPLPHKIRQHTQQVAQLSQRLSYAMERKWLLDHQKFQRLCTQLEGLSPLKILARGYSVTQTEQGNVVSESHQVQIGQRIVTQFSQGEVVSEVIYISK